MAETGGAAAPRRKLYGRRQGKALRPAQRRRLEELLPRLAVPGVALPGDPARRPVDLAALFPGACAFWLEIGFGGGEHLARQAAAHPEVGLIGCEPFVNGVAMVLGRIEAAGLRNVRIHAGDARDLIELLPEAALARVFLLYPDPWPKSRHRRRRFVSPENLALLGRAMMPGAELRLATDIPEYVEHALAAVETAEGWRVAEPTAPGRGAPWPDWAGTRYEAKAVAAGRRPHYLTFLRG
jgi:tRNA (guanine-N7-)-methyltransferase